MNAVRPLPLAAAVAHARHVPAVERERFARDLRREPAGILVETCHRVEWYGVASDGRAPLGLDLPIGSRLLVGEEAARHAITVAVGLDSVVIGEDQLLHQLRRAVEAVRNDAPLDPSLDRLFTLALRAGRRARSWRQHPSGSLADVALAAVRAHAGSLEGRVVLVIGAGTMGRLAARAAAAARAKVVVSSRTAARARAVARTSGASMAPFDPGRSLAAQATAVIVALGGPWSIGDATADALAAGGAFVIDLSVPSAVPASVVAQLGDRSLSADALTSSAYAPTHDGEAVSRIHELVEETLAEYLAWHHARDRRAVARALAERAEEDRRRELDELWRQLPLLDAEQRAVIERMSRHLAERLLREPLERLRRDPDGRHERAVRELFSL